jgi:hypothetical protein
MNPNPNVNALISRRQWAPALAACLATALTGCGAPDGSDAQATGVVQSAVYSNTLPANWKKIQIGTTSVASTAQYDSTYGGFSIAGAGSIPSSYEFVYRSLTGDGEIIAQLSDVTGGSGARAGIAVKTQLNAGSSMVALVQTSAGEGGVNQITKLGSGAASEALVATQYYVKIARQGKVISTYVPNFSGSYEQFTWRLLRQVTLADIGASAYFGLVVASGSTSAASTAAMFNVNVSAANPYTSKDIGSVGKTGTTTYTANPDNTQSEWSLSGGGSGMVGTADSLRFAYRKLTGDGVYAVRFEPANGPSGNARGGIMLRTSLNANSAGSFLSIDNSDRLWITTRVTDGAAATSTEITSVPFGGWMEIERWGQDVYVASSADGVNWYYLEHLFINATGPVYVGMADTGGLPGQLGTVTATQQTLFPSLVQP